MAETTPPTAEQLVQHLESYSISAGSPEDLVQLLRPPRLGLRSSPNLRSAYGSTPGCWLALAMVWEVETGRLEADDKAAIPSITALAAFLLSLCTQEQQNQLQAIEHVEPKLRRVLLTASSLFNLEDATYQGMTRICCQALANLVTGNEAAAAALFVRRLSLEAEDSLLQRLLASPDQGTLQAILIFLLNAVHGSRDRALLLGSSKTGAALIDRLMVLVGALFDDEVPEAIAQEEFSSNVVALTFAIMQQIIYLGVFSETYEGHALMPEFAIDPSLVTMLKMLDGFLSLPGRASSPSSLALVPFLVELLAHLSAHLINEGAQRVRDAADAATFQGVVLVLHCLCSIGLAVDWEAEQEGLQQNKIEHAQGELVEGVEQVVDLLRFSQTLLPPPGSTRATSDSAPSPAALSPKIVEINDSSSSTPTTMSDPPLAIPALAQLQRTCAQFLGIVSFSPPGTTKTSGATRRAQDRTKETGGLGILLSMCQIDERNPTMREHALFAVRNLLKGNQENQDFVEGIKPQYMVGKGGELLDLPPALRKE
ncbi:hypothetical protein JCM11641_005146 [Rhodosporidiobolus odoratus]